MKQTLQILTISILACIAYTVSAGERIGDFALIDNQGTQHHMTWYNDQHAVVILPQAVGKTNVDAISALQELETLYSERGVVFFLMNPGIETDRKAVSEDIASLGAEFPVLMDDAQLATEALGITRLDQAVVYDPKSFELVYRGPVGAELEIIYVSEKLLISATFVAAVEIAEAIPATVVTSVAFGTSL